MTLELPQTMRAVEISEFGTPNVLKMVERPVPEATHGQVVIRVALEVILGDPATTPSVISARISGGREAGAGADAE